jgi:UDP-2,3-diacylglucosamine pyrophosphatase LpxH
MKQKKHYRTIVISDVHLGTKSSKVKELLEFLKKHSFDKLILNEDIIDGWWLLRSGIEEKLTKLAVSHGCDRLICGHIHYPAIVENDNFVYMNSGDWVESLSALVETTEGKWKIILFNDPNEN